MRAPANRKGFSGWKLTKRPNEFDPFPNASDLMLNGYASSNRMPTVGKNGRPKLLPPLKNKKKKSKLAKSYNNKSEVVQGGDYYPNQQMNVQSSTEGGVFTNYKANIVGDSITNIQVGD